MTPTNIGGDGVLAPRVVIIERTHTTTSSATPLLSTEAGQDALFEMGYDSNGFIPEMQNFDEDDGKYYFEESRPTSTSTPAPSTTIAETNQYISTNAPAPALAPVPDTLITGASVTTTNPPTKPPIGQKSITVTTPDAKPSFILIEDKDIEIMKVTKLKHELKICGKRGTGNKPVLVL